MTSQVCRVCGIDKPLSDFSYRKENKKYRTNCKLCRAKQEAASRYNVTVGDVEAYRLAQEDCCAICGTHSSDIQHKSFEHNPLVIDHDHKTGEVRGLLCPTCNAGLGHFMDDTVLLANAIVYLNKRVKR